jgi:beta-lactamase class A
MKHSQYTWIRPLVTAAAFWAAAHMPLIAAPDSSSQALAQLKELEDSFKGRLGVYALDTANHKQLSYRGEEQFPVQSTFKIFVAAAALKEQTKGNPNFQPDHRISYTKQDLVFHSPITEKHVESGMTVRELIDAMLKYSDNAATNILMKQLGGPGAITQYVHSIGHDNKHFQLVSWEPNMNSSPDLPHDKSTPKAMAHSLKKLVLGNALSVHGKQVLLEGLLGNTAADKCIRAGVPADWKVADRSGGGSYGTRNDIAVLWPPNHRAPVVLSIYTTQPHTKEAKGRDDVIAGATRIVTEWVQSNNSKGR